MAKIEKALPSVFGQPREAHLAVRHPEMPDVYAPLARGLREFGGGAQHIFDGLIRLGEEGQNLALEQARADYDAEVAERLDKEVYSLSGVSAAEAGRKAESILQAAENRQLERLSAYGARPGQAFRNFAARSGAAHLSRAVGHGRAEVRRATVDAGNRVMANAAKLYTATGDASALDEINEAHARTWLAGNGRLFDAEKLAVFDRNLKEGFVAWNGEKLRVVDQIAPGDKGVIARATAEDLRARLAQESSMYEQSRQDQIDLTHAARIDQLLKWNMLSEAEAHLANDAQRPQNMRMSPGAFARAEAQLKVHRELRTAQTEARSEVQAVLALGAKEPRSLGGRYWTPAMEVQVSEALKRLNAEAAADETGRAAKKLDRFKTLINTEREARLARERADIAQLHVDLAQKGLLDPAKIGEFGDTVAAMPDSPVKDYAAGMYARNRAAVEERAARMEAKARAEEEKKAKKIEAEKKKIAANPEVRRMERAILLEFQRRWAAGEPVEFGNVKFDLSKREEFDKALDASGFTPEQKAEIRAYTVNKRIDMNAAAQVVADVLNQANGFTPDSGKGKLYFTRQAAIALCPEVMDRLEAVAKMYPQIKLDTKEGQNWMREQVLKYLFSIQASEPGWLWGVNPVLLHEFLAKGIDAEGNVVDESRTFEEFRNRCRTPEQLRRETQYREDVRAFAMGRASRVVEQDEAAALARQRGLVQTEINGESVWLPRAEAEKMKADKKKKDKAVMDHIRRYPLFIN